MHIARMKELLSGGSGGGLDNVDVGPGVEIGGARSGEAAEIEGRGVEQIDGSGEDESGKDCESGGGAIAAKKTHHERARRLSARTHGENASGSGRQKEGLAAR